MPNDPYVPERRAVLETGSMLGSIEVVENAQKNLGSGAGKIAWA